MLYKKWLILIILTVIGVQETAYGNDGEEVDLDKIPANVKKAADIALPGVKWMQATMGLGGRLTDSVNQREFGNTVYGIKGKDEKNHQVEMELSDDGIVLEVHNQMPIDDAPKAVLRGLLAKSQNVKPEIVSVLTKPGRTIWYSFVFPDGTIKRFAPDGKPVTEAERLLEGSVFVFRGTVRKLNESTIGSELPSPELIVVHIDKILRSTEALAGFENMDVTVRLVETAKPKEGQEGLFYTVGERYGKGLLVRGQARFGEKDSLATLESHTKEAIRQGADRLLTEHLANARTVIEGTVESVKSVRTARGVSWEAPEWQVAVIKVDGVKKGNTSEKSILVLFSNGDSKESVNSPKFRKGQRGVWLLHPAETLGLKTSVLSELVKSNAASGSTPFAVIDAKDCFPAEESRKIQNRIDLLK
jgi:hypothetical protein